MKQWDPSLQELLLSTWNTVDSISLIRKKVPIILQFSVLFVKVKEMKNSFLIRKGSSWHLQTKLQTETRGTIFEDNYLYPIYI